VIDRLVDDPRVIDAARIGRAFGCLPDQVMDCDRRTWAVRVAGATVVHRDSQPAKTDP
jgi:hypothetical protein